MNKWLTSIRISLHFQSLVLHSGGPPSHAMNPTRPKYIWSCEKNLIRSFNFNACFDIVTYNNYDVVHLTIHTRTVIRIHNYTSVIRKLTCLHVKHAQSTGREQHYIMAENGIFLVLLHNV